MTNPDTDKFIKQLSEFSISLSKAQLEQFIDYYHLLIEWNNVMNLTTITEPEDVFTKHFLDSLSIVRFFQLQDDFDMNSINNYTFNMIDIGTGAGFPGIPIKILFPHAKITLMDSLNKRIKFLDEVIFKLDLKDIQTVHSRAEDLAKDKSYREKYDFVVSRAVANLSTLSEYCIPFVKVNGRFISYKSERLTEELSSAKFAISSLGGSVSTQIDFHLPESDLYRNLLVIDKVKSTPNKFPRKAGLPSKEPLSM